MMRRRLITVCMALGIALIAATLTAHSPPLIVWNATSSVPIGLYRVRAADHLAVGDLVVVEPPVTLAPLFDERGYLPLGLPLLKHVAALSGSAVCRAGDRVTVDGIAVVSALDHDHRGRPLPVWQGCHHLGKGDIFLLNSDRVDSLDGRYFGAVPVGSIVGRAYPLWTWKGR